MVNHSHDTFNMIVLFGLICFGIFTYHRAVQSRKYYKCSECGESFRVELMQASHCKVCGAVVDLTENPDVTDKA